MSVICTWAEGMPAGQAAMGSTQPGGHLYSTAHYLSSMYCRSNHVAGGGRLRQPVRGSSLYSGTVTSQPTIAPREIVPLPRSGRDGVTFFGAWSLMPSSSMQCQSYCTYLPIHAGALVVIVTDVVVVCLVILFFWLKLLSRRKEAGRLLHRSELYQISKTGSTSSGPHT